MTRDYLTGFWPFRLVPIDADTGKPLDPNIGVKRAVTYYDIKKDKSGKRSLVAHKSPSPSAHGGDEGKEEKKSKGKNGGGGEEKNAEEKGGKGGGNNDDKKEHEWTKKEDAKLQDMKKDNKSWKDISKEMKIPVYQLKARWKEIEGKDAGGKAEDKKDERGKKEGKGGGEGKKNKNGPDREWTTEDDEKLKAMKAEGKDTKELAKALKRPQVNIEKRWEEIGDAKEDGKAGKKKDEKKKGESKEEKKKSEKPAKAPSKAGSTRGGEARFTMGEWLTLQEDSLFSFGELQCLSELIMKDQNLTWLRIAASFYDKTGRRVHPDDIRDKFEEMATMG